MKFKSFQTQTPNQTLAGLLAICVCVCLGCGGENFVSVPVSGTVTMDGEPLVGVEIAFFPEPTSTTSIVGPFSVGVTDSAGKFELKTRYGEPGAVVGKHRVSFKHEGVDEEEMASAVSDYKETKMSRGDTTDAKAAVYKAKAAYQARVVIPKRYTNYGSVVFYDVPAEGTDSALFELTSN